MEPLYWYDGLADRDLDSATPEVWFNGLTGGDLLDEGPEGDGVGDIEGETIVAGEGSADVEAVGEVEGETTVVGASGSLSDGVGEIEGETIVAGAGPLESGAGDIEGETIVAGEGSADVEADGEVEGETTVNSVARADVSAVGEVEGQTLAAAVGDVRTSTIIGVGSGNFTYTPVDFIEGDFNPRRNPDIQITDAANDAPSSAQYTEALVEPQLGQLTTVDFGSEHGGQLFRGPIQVVTTEWEGQRDQLKWNVSAIDFTWFLNRKRPFGRYENVSATTVVLDLIERFAFGFTTDGVQLGMAAISIEFNGEEDFASCLTRIASMVGGAWRLDQQDLIFKVDEEEVEVPDVIDDENSDLLRDIPIQVTRDATQIRTRVYVKGAGTTLAEPAVGGATELDVVSTDLFSSSGGTAIIGSQRIAYTGKADRSITPEPPPGTVPSLPSGIAAIPTPTVGNKTVSAAGARGLLTQHFTFMYRVANVYADNTESAPGPWTVPVFQLTPSAEYGNYRLERNVIIQVPAGANKGSIPCISRKIYRTSPDAPARSFPHLMVAGNNAETVEVGPAGDRVNCTIIGGTPLRNSTPPPAAPSGQPVFEDTNNDRISYGLALGPPTMAWGDGLSGTLTFRMAAVYLDGTEGLPSLLTAPITMHAAVPGANRGESLLAVASYPSAPASINGVPLAYWKVYWNNPVSSPDFFCYGYVDPRTSFGNLIIPISYTLADAPDRRPRTAPVIEVTSELHHFLTGVTGLALSEPAGASVNIFEQCDDVPAQTDLATTEGGDGLHEYMLAGEYNSHAIARAAGFGQLSLYSRPITTVRYATRDPKTKAGRLVEFNLTDPPISETLRIQDVQIDQIHTAEGLTPRYTATASTIRFSFDDLMKKIIEEI